jgi:hypothetical protein
LQWQPRDRTETAANLPIPLLHLLGSINRTPLATLNSKTHTSIQRHSDRTYPSSSLSTRSSTNIRRYSSNKAVSLRNTVSVVTTDMLATL